MVKEREGGGIVPRIVGDYDPDETYNRRCRYAAIAAGVVLAVACWFGGSPWN